MIKFSFIIPVYNCGKYLTDCINSIEKISLLNYEILLIDDGSTDGTSFLCDELAYQSENIKCYHQKNQGVSAARNQGLELSTGDYVIFFDADDSIESHKFLDLLMAVEKDETINMFIFGLSFDFYYKNNRYRRDELNVSFNGKLKSSVWIKYMPELFEKNALSPIWNKVIKRSFLESNHLRFREDMFLYEDLEFSLRCLSHCDSIYFSSDVIYHYRQSEDEGNAGRRLKKIKYISKLINQIESALNGLIKNKHAEVYQEQMKEILLTLYVVLAREKISVSNVNEIRQICDDFSSWIKLMEMKVPEKNKDFIKALLNKRIYYLVINKIYVQIRHKIAVRIKSIKRLKKNERVFQ